MKSEPRAVEATGIFGQGVFLHEKNPAATAPGSNLIAVQMNSTKVAACRCDGRGSSAEN